MPTPIVSPLYQIFTESGINRALSVGSALPTRGTVAAIAVSYQPNEHSVTCLRTLSDKFACTVIVDNCSTNLDAAKLFHELASRPGVVLIKNHRNLGIAAALNQGIEAARRMGYSWFYLSDQDSQLLTDPLDVIQAVYAAFVASTPANKLGLIGATFIRRESDTDDATPRVVTGGLDRYCSEMTVITSGTALPLSTFEKLGPFREDFFIDHVDHEYCLRARKAGLEVLRSLTPTLLQNLGNFTPYRGLMSLFSRRGSYHYSPLRRYYYARNFVVLRREYRADFPNHIRKLGRDFFRECLRILKYESQRMQKFRMIVRGIIDARKGLMGDFNTAHPSGSKTILKKTIAHDG